MLTLLALPLLLLTGPLDPAGPSTSHTHRSPAAGHLSALRRWDATGHRTMAAIAYDRLTLATRLRVDALLRAHPDLDSLSRGVDVGTAAGVRELFLRASVWPDQIRRDPRFFNETDSTRPPTPLLPGFPSMASRAGWHYLSRAFSTDGTPTEVLTEPNVTTALPGFADALGDPAIPVSVQAYGLSWIVHVVGDLHQPLHGISRASAANLNGDAGGNREWVQFGPSPMDTANLHAVWDGLLRRSARGTPVDLLSRELESGYPIDATSADLDIPDGAALAARVQQWADESATLSRYVVYDFPARADGGAPPRLSASYLELADTIARQRITLAGYRLAALLEARLAPKGSS